MKSYQTFKICLILLSCLSGCGLYSHAVVAPFKPELPIVHFTKPSDPGSIICLNTENSRNLLERETLVSEYIARLEYVVAECE